MNAEDLLTRAVANVIPRDLAQKKLSSDTELRVYLGIDPTGSKLHLGHTVPLRKLQAFAEAGHHAIFLIGSFTAMIGDPSERDTQREPLTRNQVEKNFQTYKEQAAKVLDFTKVEVVYNHEWLARLTFEEIAKLASHFTVQQMSERDMFEKRMQAGKPVHLHEFLYPLMVGYDSVVLDVDCEIGATDQEFNMLAGRTLQAAYGKREKFVLTIPLIAGTDGRKMSKTYGNCIYLEDEPHDMFGKLMSLHDDLILTYMECCTDIPMEEIRIARDAMKSGANPRDFKMRLAHEIVRMYHGDAAAKDAQDEFIRVFQQSGLPDDIPEITAEEGSALLDLLVREKLVPSKSEGKRLMQQGGIKLNEKVITTLETTIEAGVLRVGKRKFVKIALR